MNLTDLDDLLLIIWECLNSAQRLALILQIFAYELLNRFERIEIRLLASFTFLIDYVLFGKSFPPHPLSKFLTLGAAFYSVTLFLLLCIWPSHNKKAHWIRS